MSLEDIAKKVYPYTLLGTTAGLVWLGNNPSAAVPFYSAKADDAFKFFVDCHRYYAPLELVTSFYIISKMRNLNTTVLEPIVKNEYLFLNLQNMIGAVFIGLASSQEVFVKNFADLCYKGALVNLAYTQGFKISLEGLKLVKPPHFFNLLKSVCLSSKLVFGKKDNFEKLEKTIEKINQLQTENKETLFDLVTMIHSQKVQREYLENALTRTNEFKRNYQKRNLFTFFANMPLELDMWIARLLFYNVNTMSIGTTHLSRLNLSSFMQCYEREIEATKSPEAQLLYALFLDRLSKDKDEVNKKISISRRWRVLRRLRKEFGEGSLEQLLESKANKEWEKVVNRIINDERFETTQESIEGKKVYRAGVYPILKTVIIVKEDEKSVLESEINNLNYLRNKITNPNFEVANALKIMELNGKPILVERHSSGKRLTEILEEKEDFKLLSKVVEYLKQMHDVMPMPQKVLNPEEELISILRKTQLNDKTKQILYDGVKVTLPNLSKTRVFDADAHQDNWFIAGERIIAIDKPTRKAIPPEYDLNKLLNRGKTLSTKEDLIQIYSPEDEFLFAFYNSSSMKALSYFVFTQTYQQRNTQAIQFVENAVKDLEILKERYGRRFSRDNIGKLELLSTALEGLKLNTPEYSNV